MNEKLEKIFNDLVDLIEVLKQEEKCSCPKFQQVWSEKNKMIQDKIKLLSQEEFKMLEEHYKNNCKINLQ